MAHYDSLAIETVTFNGVVSGEYYKTNKVIVSDVSGTETEYDALINLAKDNYVSTGGSNYPPQVWH